MSEQTVMEQTVAENDVLIGIALWLRNRKIVPVQFSIASGQGIDAARNKKRLESALEEAGYRVRSDLYKPFVKSGPDLIGISENEFWQIECKGAGTGKSSTQRNNFDRALASVVSYYTDSPLEPLDGFGFPEAQPCLGLALPRTPAYISQLKKRVRSPLRKRLNLWVLLFEPKSGSVTAVSPEDDY